MAHEAYIEYKGKGFWIPEAFIEVLSQFICKACEEIGFNNLSPALRGIYDDCDGNRSGELYDMVNISFDDHIISEKDKFEILGLLNNAKKLISCVGLELGISILNEFEGQKTNDYFKRPWAFPIQTKSLVNTIEIIEQMLNGTWESSNYGVWYAGFPNSGFPEI